ncbi:hypothetical protein GQ53DRAFT_837144 [Thozetella sp. PMI_491]|nr:hypothetical protein GQ53DRAFT_837144 [Thozetella sp. PMI_491]
MEQEESTYWSVSRPKRQRRQAQGQSQTFAFVEYAGPGRALSTDAESTIRRHAMKEIGKSRQKPKSSKFVELDLSALSETRSGPMQPSWWLGNFWRQVDSGILDPFVRFPIEIDACSRRLIANIFQDDDSGQQKPLRDAWFTVGLEDEAAFLQVLANSALHLDSILHDGRLAHETSDSMKYHARALESVQRRISDGGTSDGLLGSVTGFMCHADIVGNVEAWITHYEGLKRMVELRGGVVAVEKNTHLRITLSWCEIRGIYMVDTPPAFPLPVQWLSFLHHSPAGVAWCAGQDADGTLVTQQSLTDGGEMSRMYQELMLLTRRTFSRASVNTKSSVSTIAGAWVNPMVHVLLSWRPLELSAEPAALVQEAFRLGALLYLAPIWRHFGVAPVISDRLVRNLQNLLDDPAIDRNENWKVILWALCVGACETQADDQVEWFAKTIVSMLREQRIQSWEDAMVHVRDVLWVDEVLAARASKLEAQITHQLQDSQS